MSIAVAKAKEFWGQELPDWIEALATACDTVSARAAAAQIGRSAGLVSQVLRRKYPGDMGAVEDAVRGAFMNAKIICPALGEIGTHTCQEWRLKGKTFVNVNSLRITMYRACRLCPRNRKEDVDA